MIPTTPIDVSVRHFYETFRIGNAPASADEGAALLYAGIKTATSSRLWEYEAGGVVPPAVGALSLVEDGSGRTRCVVESTEIIIQPLVVQGYRAFMVLCWL